MRKKILLLACFFAWLVPSAIASYHVFSGGMAFWYDPARDMLSAWDNLSKVTLIGSTSGIPGIFYGPYWIWWLSFTELFSKDPRFVLYFTTTLPYLLLFPFFLALFSKIFDKGASILLWLLFFFAYEGYITALWNPNLAPLLFLITIYLLVSSSSQKNLKEYVTLFLAGLVGGLAFNIHISFSFGFIGGIFLFIFSKEFLFVSTKGIGVRIRRVLLVIGSFLFGFVIVFWPFVLFELRHGFQQTHTLLHAIAQGGDVVMVQGLSKSEIITQFFASFAKLLSLPFIISLLVLGISSAWLGLLVIKKKVEISFLQKNLLLLLASIVFCVMGIYLSVKNPIWTYHFIGMEIVFLLFLGILLTKISQLKYIVTVWIVIIASLQMISVIKSFSYNPLQIETLYAKEYTVSLITKDIKNNTYTVFAYNPAIYSYDYSYLFRWEANKSFSYDPGQIQTNGVVYLILPKGEKAAITDFIHFHTPDSLYKTTKVWTIPNGTAVLRRTPILSKI